MKSRTDREAALIQFNNSELLEVLAANDFPGIPKIGHSKGLPREVLVTMILEYRPALQTDALAQDRAVMSRTFKKYWDRIQGQATTVQCPECADGKVEGGKLLRCSDIAVAACKARNAKFIP